MRVPVFRAFEYATFDIVQRREQRGCSMPDIIMRLGLNMTDAQRQSGLCALQSLPLAFFITAEHQRFLRRIKSGLSSFFRQI